MKKAPPARPLPLGDWECGGWWWALGVQGGLRTRRGGSNRSRRGCEGPLRGHNPVGRGGIPATHPTRCVCDDARPPLTCTLPQREGTGRRGRLCGRKASAVHTTGPGGPSPHPPTTQPAAGATTRRPAARQTGTYAAPQSATARPPAARQTGTYAAPQSATARPPAAQQTVRAGRRKAQRRATPTAGRPSTWEAPQSAAKRVICVGYGHVWEVLGGRSTMHGWRAGRCGGRRVWGWAAGHGAQARCGGVGPSIADGRGSPSACARAGAGC